MRQKTESLRSTVLAGVFAALVGAAQAQVAEDSSAAFESGQEAMGAALGLPEAEATVTTHANGMTSALIGLEGMKMLVARQNEDGSVSYDHVSSEEEAHAFQAGDINPGPAEK